jgi:hypothetical protein
VELGVIAVLTADVTAQMTLIGAIETKVKARAANLRAEDEASLESLAYQIHNFYNAVEDLLKLLAARFENHITETAQWHSALLQRMTQAVVGMRPAVLSAESYTLLNGLRGFRHFFRHAYGVAIEYEQLKVNLGRVQQLQPLLNQDIQRFLAALSAENA